MLKKVTENDIAKYDRENGEEGCYALYDSGANTTETCTQFKLKDPYICCQIFYKVGTDFENKFCLPIVNNIAALKDVEYAFRDASYIEINCGTKFINTHLFLYILTTVMFLL